LSLVASRLIGELARWMKNPRDQLLYSRSARDLISICKKYPELVVEITSQRSILAEVPKGQGSLEVALDRERRDLIRANESRLALYSQAAKKWRSHWQSIEKRIHDMTLADAHGIIVKEAETILPFNLDETHA